MKVTINKNNKQIMDWRKILQCLKPKGTNSYNVQGIPTKITNSQVQGGETNVEQLYEEMLKLISDQM